MQKRLAQGFLGGVVGPEAGMGPVIWEMSA